MTKYKKLIMISLIASSMALSPLVNTQADASSESYNKPKIGGERDYQETVGPHLRVHITGIDKKGNEILYPHYLEFPLKSGKVLNKKEIIKYVEWTLDSTSYNKYRVVDFAPNSKIEVSYFSKTKKQVVTESFPITEKGFTVPDLSEHEQNPTFNLITNVVIEEKKLK